MFDFRIITLPDGNQIIDPSLKTPYNSLTPSQMVEYAEMDNRITFMDRMAKKASMDERKRKIGKNPFYRVAAFCGLV